MSAPPASLPDAGQHGTYHADNGDESYHGEEPAKYDVCEYNPVERQPWTLEMSVETFLLMIDRIDAKIDKIIRLSIIFFVTLHRI